MSQETENMENQKEQPQNTDKHFLDKSTENISEEKKLEPSLESLSDTNLETNNMSSEEAKKEVMQEGISQHQTKESNLSSLETEDKEQESEERPKETTELERVKPSQKEEENVQNNEVPTRDYTTLTQEGLIAELEFLITHFSINKISAQAHAIRNEFNSKSKVKLNEAREKFIAEGGNENDFVFEDSLQNLFNSQYSEYKKQISTYYKLQDKNQEKALEERLHLIESLKALYLSPPNNNADLFKNFREIKTQWHNAGKIASNKVNEIYKNYHHHLDNFYEYLNLNKELRELDFAHNLEVRYSIIKRAEELLQETHIQKALNELQHLHRMWKEEAVPVADEFKEITWQKFKEITQQLHDKRTLLNDEIKQKQAENIRLKKEIVSSIRKIAENTENSHNFFQKTQKEIENLRTMYLKIGRGPTEENNELWNQLKEALKNFNHHKNNFYKTLKKANNENISVKKQLVEQAIANKDREDWDEALIFYKKIQQDWKKSGHIPRKLSDKFWKEFHEAANYFFERYKNRNNKVLEVWKENLNHKKEYLKTLQEQELSNEQEIALAQIDQWRKQWKTLGKVPNENREIDQEFSQLIKQKSEESNLEISIDEINLQLKINDLEENKDQTQVHESLQKLKEKIEVEKQNLNHLETNLSYFSSNKKDNPIMVNFHKDIKKSKEKIDSLNLEFRKIKKIQNKIQNQIENDKVQNTEGDNTETNE